MILIGLNEGRGGFSFCVSAISRVLSQLVAQGGSFKSDNDDKRCALIQMERVRWVALILSVATLLSSEYVFL